MLPLGILRDFSCRGLLPNATIEAQNAQGVGQSLVACHTELLHFVWSRRRFDIWQERRSVESSKGASRFTRKTQMPSLSGNHDTISTFLFSAIEGRIGGAQQRVPCCTVRRKIRYTDRQAHGLQGLAAKLRDVLFHYLTQ